MFCACSGQFILQKVRPKPKYNYKPSLHHKKRNVLYVSDHHDSVNDSLSENPVVHEVALSNKRCYDNLLRVKIGHVKTVALVDTGASMSCISHNLLCKIQLKQVQYLPGDVSKILVLEILFKMFLIKCDSILILIRTSSTMIFMHSKTNIHWSWVWIS